MSTVRDLLTLPNISIRVPWMRMGAGCLFGILTVAVQTLFFSDAPIHFAPSLVAIAMATLYLGYRAGVATLVTSAVLINYALLHPRWAWSSSTEALNATAVYLVVAVVLVVAMGPLHQRLSRLERSLESAQGEAATEAQLREKAEGEFQARLSEMQGKCEKILDLAQSAASISRYADTVVKRLSAINAAIAETPSPSVMLEDKNGIPIIRATSRRLIDLSGVWDGPTSVLHAAIESIRMLDGCFYATKQHPLMQAARGSVVYGERVGWLSLSGEFVEASLYAVSVADGRMLAMAIVAAPETPVSPAEG